MIKKLKTQKARTILVLLAISILLISCDKKRVFDEYVSVSEQSWDKDNSLRFNFSVSDTLTKKNLFINLRNNNEYAYSNLFLITQMTFPDGQRIIDTLEYDMTDATGKFLGKGFSDIKENKLFYKEHIIFPKRGDYSLVIKQAMRENGEANGIQSLKGVSEVGFRIENNIK